MGWCNAIGTGGIGFNVIPDWREAYTGLAGNSGDVRDFLGLGVMVWDAVYTWVDLNVLSFYFGFGK